MTYEGAKLLTFLILIAETVLFVRSLLVAFHLKNKRSILCMILAWIAVGYSFAVAYQEPVMDWWYYLGSLFCLGASSIMCMENHMPMLVFGLSGENSIIKALTDEFDGTYVYTE